LQVFPVINVTVSPHLDGKTGKVLRDASFGAVPVLQFCQLPSAWPE
jgi:hypothetical protein